MSQYANEVNRYLSKIKSGDRSKKQIEGLFNLTANHLRIVAKMYLYNKSYEKDVVNEAYQKAIKYINTFDEKQDGYNWLCKITQRIAYTYNEQNSDFDTAATLDETTVVSYNSFELIDERIDLLAALNELDPESRTIIVKYFYLGETLEQIGEELEKGKSAIHKQIKRILKRMKKLL